MLQRGFPLTGINFDSPGATGKNIPRQKGEGYFLVLQRGFPLTGINFDSPGATGKNIPRQKGEGYFLVLQRGFEPRTPCLKGRCSAY